MKKEVITIKVSESEKEEVKKRAEKLGMSLSAYVRYVLFVKRWAK